MTRLWGALWIEVAGQSAIRPDPIVWQDDFPASYVAVVDAVGVGFSTTDRVAAQEAADRCFVAAWRWERAGAHRVLSEREAHSAWRSELAAIDRVLDAAESYSRPLSEALAVPAGYAAKLEALGYPVAPVSMPDAEALTAAEAQLLTSGAPQYIIDAGLASLAALRAGPKPPPAPPPLPRTARIARAFGQAAGLSPELRAQVEAIPTPPAPPPAFDPQYFRHVQRAESDDVILRDRTWGALETEFVDALKALKTAL